MKFFLFIYIYLSYKNREGRKMHHTVAMLLLSLFVSVQCFSQKPKIDESHICDIHINYDTKSSIVDVKKEIVNVIKDQTINGYYMEYCANRVISDITEVRMIFRSSQCKSENEILIECSFLQTQKTLSWNFYLCIFLLLYIIKILVEIIAIRAYHHKYLKDINYPAPLYVKKNVI